MSPARRLLLSGVAIVLAVVAATLLVARLTRSGADPVVRADQAQPGTVVLVPGYGGSTSALQVLAGKLEAAGRTTAVVDLPDDGTGDLRESAAVLDGVVDAALAAGAPSVDVVGYSAGGVTARYWLRELGGAAVTRRVLTLGSPHHGTRVAEVGAALGGAVCPVACQQLVPGSDLLRALNQGDETPEGPEYLALWTDQDETVTPPASGRLEGATSLSLQAVCPGLRVEHSQLPRVPLVRGIAIEALGAEPLAAPADCAALTRAGR